jgi:hypothetical protein
MARFDTKDLALWAVILRKIWFKQNSVVHRGAFSHLDKMVRKAIVSSKEFKNKNMRDMEGTVAHQGRPPASWIAPSHGMVKVNWDAAFNKEKWYSSCGIIACDCARKVLARNTTQVMSRDPTMHGWGMGYITSDNLQQRNWSFWYHIGRRYNANSQCDIYTLIQLEQIRSFYRGHPRRSEVTPIF